mmetsp:Transcript_8560/g.20340  ORF Transcript_8560/g.20340 Transcript_8560/m.20340 type:complete len:242 (-) Transcript_8560:1746-2471(-)
MVLRELLFRHLTSSVDRCFDSEAIAGRSPRRCHGDISTSQSARARHLLQPEVQNRAGQYAAGLGAYEIELLLQGLGEVERLEVDVGRLSFHTDEAIASFEVPCLQGAQQLRTGDDLLFHLQEGTGSTLVIVCRLRAPDHLPITGQANLLGLPSPIRLSSQAEPAKRALQATWARLLQPVLQVGCEVCPLEEEVDSLGGWHVEEADGLGREVSLHDARERGAVPEVQSSFGERDASSMPSPV